VLGALAETTSHPHHLLPHGLQIGDLGFHILQMGPGQLIRLATGFLWAMLIGHS
jgi:hypothetical protein